MTRINTNVSSINAQKSLARSNVQLQQALTRLSTGLRINVGKDDPAGLIASEVLRSDIVSVERAISNSERSNQMVAIADSALGAASSLLNDIRALVTEAANEGVMSAEQIAANQLQVDSALEALNRIAQTTSFQGRKLLDGSLEFVTTAGTVATIEDIQIEQANLGATDSIAVDVDISAAAEQASITNGIGTATKAAATLSFAASMESGSIGSGAQITVTATSLGSDESGVDVIIADGGSAIGQGNETAVYDSTQGTLTITIDATDTDVDDVLAAINTQVAEFHAVQSTGAGTDTVLPADATLGTTGVDQLTITAVTAAGGADLNHMAISLETQAGLGAGNELATYDATENTLIITIDDDEIITLAQLETAFGTVDEFDAAASSGVGSDSIDAREVDDTATANTGTTGGNVLDADLVVEIGGSSGTEVFTFQAGSSVNQVTWALNLLSDATGVAASQSAGTLTFQSSGYGSDALVYLNVISEGTGGTFESGLSAARETGTDIVATVNGLSASGDGNTLSINTSMLDMSITVTAGSDTDFEFNITGGGALFQLGPDVVSSQQARLGISSVNTARLGGVSGLLYELGSGEAAALATDPTTAASIVDEVITEVTELRGRLGAFQRTTLDVNITTLTDTLENLTAAESSIRDADFAAETAALTRAQILVQSGVSVLGVANSNPQNVLALLR